MKFNISIKKVICLLLALLMLLSVGCTQNTKKKKKKVIIEEEEVIVIVQDEQQGDNDKNSTTDNDNSDSDGDNNYTSLRASRPLPTVKTETEKYVEVFTPEFDYEYSPWGNPSDYVIVYSHKQPVNRLAAQNLKIYFKDNYKVNLEVYKDTDTAAASAQKKILVGDTAYGETLLTDTRFAVTLKNDNLYFEGGNTTMVEKAVDWFTSIEVKSGNVATLSGTADDFVTTLTLNGHTYNYVWGDEFDGEEFLDTNKWNQTVMTVGTDQAVVHEDPHFNRVEDGRLKMTSDRYCDETDPSLTYGTSGCTGTGKEMLFRNGYLEVRARLPYIKGAFPAIWTMSADCALSKSVPNYNVDDGYGIYKNRAFEIEFDLMEAFSDLDNFSTQIHKWYTGIKNYDAEAKTANVYFVNGGKEIAVESFKDPFWNTSSSVMVQSYNHAYEGYSDYTNYNWTHYFTGEALEKLNEEYHTYGLLYTGEFVKCYIDGKCYLEFDWDIAWDYVNNVDVSDNNGGVGMNLWQQILLDVMIYTPENTKNVDASRQVTKDELPMTAYFDYVRLYQTDADPSQSIYWPAVQD